MPRKTKRFLSALCALVVLVSAYAGYVLPFRTYVQASQREPELDLENDLKWFGRTYAENGTHYFSWSNSGFQFTFYGTGATATLKSTLQTPGDASQTAYIKIYVDNVEKKHIPVYETENPITLAAGLNEGLHTIKVVKSTGGENSVIALSNVQLAAGGKIRQTQKYSDRKILFIGDDFTTGRGSEITAATTDAQYDTTAYEDSTISYTALAAEYFGAENMTVALSGRGLVKNEDGGTAHIAKMFFEYLDYRNKSSVNYDHTQYNPDVVVINLGNYDEVSGVDGDTFKTACQDFLLQVHAAYPDAKVIYTYGLVYNGMEDYIKAAIATLNNGSFEALRYKTLTALGESEKGFNQLPNKAAHVSRSVELIDAIEEVTGWTGKDEVINPVSKEVQVSNLHEPIEQTDLTIMTFNVHTDNEDSSLSVEERKQKAVELIRVYDPDIIGIQGASDAEGWETYFETYLSEYGDVTWKDASKQKVMSEYNGLINLYKKDRFTLDSGRTMWIQLAGGEALTAAIADKSRAALFIAVQEKTTGQYIPFFNTYLSSEETSDTPQSDRVVQCRQLSFRAVSSRNLNSLPGFVVGDFNANYTNDQEALNKFLCFSRNDDGSNEGVYGDAALEADSSRFFDYNNSNHHIFTSKGYVVVKEYHVAEESIDGRKVSANSPHIAYCNFRPGLREQDYEKGFDRTGELFTDSSNTNSYQFDFIVDENYTVYDEVGNACNHAVTLSKRINKFALRYKDSGSNYLYTAEAIITNTSIPEPILTTTGSSIREPYFAKGAYHILVDGNTLGVSADNGSFYTNPYATVNETANLNLTSISAGRTVYYLKTTQGDIYPVYIYKQTKSSTPSTLYVDDDIGSATSGKVAFYDGKDVIFVNKGNNAFATVGEVATMANRNDGYTIYFAPGDYGSNEVVFTKNVTLLGNNHDVAAVDISVPNWSMSGRKDETVIDGGFIFDCNGSISVTVKGFTIEGYSTNGPIYFKNTSEAASIANHVQTLDIQNNIITGGGNGISGKKPSAINAFSGAQVKGLIKNNYLRCMISQPSIGEHGYTKALYISNPNGLVMESNYFIGYDTCGYFTGEVQPDATVAGYCNYSFIGNRFELCNTIKTFVKGIASTSADIFYHNNDFIRCGKVGYEGIYHALNFDFTENKVANDCSKISINLLGNRFSDCLHSVNFERSLDAGQQGDLSQINLKINKNRFVNPTEANWEDGSFYSIKFDFLTNNSITSGNTTVDWDISDNHFESTFIEDERENLISLDSVSQVQFNQTIPELNYISNATSQATSVQPIVLTSDSFEPKVNAYDAIQDAFYGAEGVSDDEYRYYFDEDVEGMNIESGISSIRDKMTPGTKVYESDSDTLTITPSKTLQIKGQSSIYTDNRWTGPSLISFDLKSSATKYDSDRAVAHFKYGYGSISSTPLGNSVFYESDDVGQNNVYEGFSLAFSTNDQGETVIAIRIPTANASDVDRFLVLDVVKNMNGFNKYRVVEEELGTIEMYANNKLFARLICSDSTSYSMRSLNVSAEQDSYYDTVQVYTLDSDLGVLSYKGTVNDAKITKHSALAFATTNDEISGETMEVDNLLITSDTDVIIESDDEDIVPLEGTITVANAQNGITYSAYNMANVMYDSQTQSYSYKVAAGWGEFFAGKGDYALVKEVFNVSGGYIANKSEDVDPTTMEQIAKLAIKYAQEKGLDAAGSAVASNGIAVINVNQAGYYVVDSALGTICSIGTYATGESDTPNVNVYEKNNVPTLEKFVKESEHWKLANDGYIGSTVEFKILVHVAKGATGYVVHDELGEGFANLNNVVVTKYESDYVNDEDNTGGVQYTPGDQYTIIINENNFTLTFDDDNLALIPEQSVIEIKYCATIDNDALIDDPNINMAYMKFGETGVAGVDTVLEKQTVTRMTNTYVWSFGIDKYYEKDGVETALPGAKFKLYATNPEDDVDALPMEFVSVDGDGTYRLATQADDAEAKINLLESPNTGDYRLQGFDSAMYYLVEEEAPEGFNKLATPVRVTISSEEDINDSTKLIKTVTAKQGTVPADPDVGTDIIKVLNQTGLVLPSTGGFTNMFILTGATMVMSMGMLLVVRRRMTKIVYIKNDAYYEED